MNINDLDRYLEQGHIFGIQLKTQDQRTLSWISFEKRVFPKRFFEIFEREEEPFLYDEMYDKKMLPYTIRLVCVKKIEDDRFYVNDDYLVNKGINFMNIEEAVFYLRYCWGFSIEELKWYSDIDHD